jgi:hypothetical protein
MLKGLLCLCAFFIGCGSTVNAASFLPENTLYLEDGLGLANMTQSEFQGAINKAQQLYAPIAAINGGSLAIKGAWTDSTVNAYASQAGRNWTVMMYGGLARRPEVTIQGFYGVICHELGHHLSGFPMYPAGQGQKQWAGAEGNSDYFAYQVCMKKMLADEMFAGDDYPQTVLEKCDDVYSNNEAKHTVCLKSIMSAISLSNLLATLNRDQVSIDTYDPLVVKSTNTSYPSTTQCRLDTMVAGAVCTKPWNDNVVPANEAYSNKQVCIAGLGKRPACWFKPGKV